MVPEWPVERGGSGLGPLAAMILREEFQFAEAPAYAPVLSAMVAKVVDQVGTPAQRDAVVPGVLRGETSIVLGFSEPEAGSDVAAARTRAVREGDEWIVNGQKMFTTNAQVADYAFLLARTNPDVAKHQGLTTFLVPLDHEGVEVQAVYTLSGERTNITFYNDVRVPDSLRVGDVDGGWQTLTLFLQDEHAAGFGGHLQRLVMETEDWARAPGADGIAPIDDPAVRRRLARAATEAEVGLLLQRRGAWMVETGSVPEAEGPMAKLFTSEALERAAQDLAELVGPDALRSYFDPTAGRTGRIEHLLRFSLGTTIYAGTSEIQRNIIAQRGLGLPR
jgi:alkylation response protein AidB-like acyl-CoA dehydrogenase